MTEPISFGANVNSRRCRCDQKFWTYPQQNKGRITNLIINQTKMTKIRDLIEKIWWVIPPIIVVFGITLVYTIFEMIGFSHPALWFFWYFGKNLCSLFLWIFTDSSPTTAIIIMFFLGFMGYGYYLVRKQPSLIRRIIIPLILGMVGFFAGTILMAMMGAH
jgi:hypothetical protein